MHKKNYSLKFLILSIFSLIALAALIYFIPPTFMIPIFTIQIPMLPLFFCLLFIFLFSTGAFIFKSPKHGILIALFVSLYLLFRLNNLTHPFFFIILAALFLTVELLFSYRKE